MFHIVQKPQTNSVVFCSYFSDIDIRYRSEMTSRSSLVEANAVKAPLRAPCFGHVSKLEFLIFFPAVISCLFSDSTASCHCFQCLNKHLDAPSSSSSHSGQFSFITSIRVLIFLASVFPPSCVLKSFRFGYLLRSHLIAGAFFCFSFCFEAAVITARLLPSFISAAQIVFVLCSFVVAAFYHLV